MHENKPLQKLTLQQILLGAIAAMMGIGLLKLGQSIFMPLVLALCLAFILMPIVDKLDDWGLPRLLGSLLALGITTGFVAGLGTLMSLSLGGVQERMPYYMERAIQVSRPLEPFLNRLHLSLSLDSLLTFFDRAILASFAGSSFVFALDILAQGVLVFFICLFTLVEADQFRGKLIRAFGLHNVVNDSSSQIARQIQRYLLTKTLISLGVGLMVWIFLAWMGVDFALI